MLRHILTATIFSASATLSGAQAINANDLNGLISNASPETEAENINAGTGTTAFDDLVRSAALDLSTIGATLGKGGAPIRNGVSLAQVFCGTHQRFESRLVAPSFASMNTPKRGSFDPLALQLRSLPLE
ncbi:hypothetical protein NBRC116594_35730 [Shimia sp. NS0008-38b]|uniref:hypothetical protein n=1 Tax=Shimia sp. NS0008-38b TaxID=3127653 RepID=UPI00310C39CD